MTFLSSAIDKVGYCIAKDAVIYSLPEATTLPISDKLCHYCKVTINFGKHLLFFTKKCDNVISRQNKLENLAMTENEMKLLEMIRKNNNPEQALLTAVKVIVDYLNRHGSSESISSVASQEFA